MEVGVCIAWQVIIDGQIYTLNVDTPPEDISGDADTLVEFFEFFVAFDTVIISMRWSNSFNFVLTALLG